MLNELIQNLLTAKNVEQEATNVLKLCKSKREETELRLIEFMDDEAITAFEFEGQKIKRTEDILPSLKVEHHEEFRLWLGEDEKKVFKYSPSKLKSYVKELVKDDKPIPDIITIYRKPVIKITNK